MLAPGDSALQVESPWSGDLPSQWLRLGQRRQACVPGGRAGHLGRQRPCTARPRHILLGRGGAVARASVLHRGRRRNRRGPALQRLPGDRACALQSWLTGDNTCSSEVLGGTFLGRFSDFTPDLFVAAGRRLSCQQPARRLASTTSLRASSLAKGTLAGVAAVW